MPVHRSHSESLARMPREFVHGRVVDTGLPPKSLRALAFQRRTALRTPAGCVVEGLPEAEASNDAHSNPPAGADHSAASRADTRRLGTQLSAPKLERAPS
jgi:hypothetical protein